MDLFSKYKIRIINNKRYYEFDMKESLPLLENSAPYLFKYKGIEIYESTWNKMTLRILEMLDSINPKSEEELLSIHYSWSKQDVFCRTNRTNHTPYKGLFLNTNHSACHAMMSIQCLLKAYNIEAEQCYFLIRKHFISESEEVKKYIRTITIDDFKKSLSLKKIELNKIDIIVNNFKVINKYLGNVSSGYNDFWLFDDYYYFNSYKNKTLEEIKKWMPSNDKKSRIIVRCLDYLDDFYKNRALYEWLNNNKIEQSFLDLICKEIDYLFENLKTDIIVCNKIYSRMILLYDSEMKHLGEMNNPTGLYKIVTTLLSNKYYCKNSYISKNPINNITNEQMISSYISDLDEFTITSLNNYIEKMHLKKLDNYMMFIENISDSFVQVDVERLISIKKFFIPSNTINLLKKEIRFYIDSFGVINSDNFLGYESLPKLNYEWNKYLLLGIIRTFLSDVFSIETAGVNYKKISYKINIL